MVILSTIARIHPCPQLKGVPFANYKAAIEQMLAEGLYDLATGWRPESRERVLELLGGVASQR